MGKFKEQKKSAIEKGAEIGKAGINKGEQRVAELRSVKNLIDSLELRDEIDKEQAEQLKQQYKEAGIKAHEQEVKSAVDMAKDKLNENKNDISAEQGKVEDAIRKVGEMKGTSDLARNEASKVEGNLQKSAEEYKVMEREIDHVKAYQEQRQQNIRQKIDNIFG